MTTTKPKDAFTDSADFKVLVQALGYQFNDPALLRIALTHRSVLEKESEHPHGVNNERLEFLGDAVLSLVSASYLYGQNNRLNEGDLSRLRAQYVCQEHLAKAARAIDLGRYIKSDKAMRASGSTNSKAILADAVEAIIGAVFIDGGLVAAQGVVFQILGEPTLRLLATEKDPKTRLQEIIQANTQDAPKYVVVESTGPAHAPTFVVAVTIKDEILAQATGESKKTAAQNAAIIALEKISTGAGFAHYDEPTRA